MYENAYGRIAEMYDGDYAHLRTPRGDVDFYVDEAKRAGGPVLEIGCGTGRILVPIADAGVAVAGLDFSEPMLAKAREKREGLDLHQGDMRDFDLGRTFKLVTIPFRALSHIDRAEDHIAVFRNVRRHLDADGRFIFDVFHPSYKHLAEDNEDVLGIERDEDGKKIRRYFSSFKHPARQMMDCSFRWEIEDADGGIETFSETFTMRWFFRFELEHALDRAGFDLEVVWGDFDRSPLADDSPELLFVARPKP